MTEHETKPSQADDLRQIADAFARLGREVATGSPTQTFEAVTRAAVRHVPGAQRSSMTTYEGAVFRTVAATDDVARRADEIQYTLGSGPCVDAIVDSALYHPKDLEHDGRWPEYGRIVSEELGIHSMLSYRLSLEAGEAVAGLNLYGDEVDAFDEDALLVGLMLAAHGAMAVSRAALRERGDNLEKGLTSNRDIGVAMGILMARHHVTRDQAFDLLRMASQRANRKLRDVAVEVGDTGDLPPLAPGG